MMQRNPRAFLRAAATVLRPATTTVFLRAVQTSTAWAPPPTRRPLFPPAHRGAFSTTANSCHGKSDVDIMELPGAYYYVLDVPGRRAGDLTVKLVPDRWLQFSVEPRLETMASACSYIRKERPMGKLNFYFRLAGDADLSSVSAVCQDGVLTVTVDKLPPPPAAVVIPRTIEVKS